MHLTNYTLNKKGPNFQANQDEYEDDVGHKRSLVAVFKILKEKGIDTDSIWKRIKRIVNKTLCAVQPQLCQTYVSCSGNDVTSDK